MRLTILRCVLAWLLPVAALAQTTNTARLLWRLEVPGSPSESSPAIAPDGTIYLGTFNGSLIAVTPEGKLKWRFKTDREIHASPAVGADGTIYAGSRDRNFYAVTPAGILKWKFATGGWVDSSAAVAADGTVYFGSNDKYLYALTPDGKLKWKFPTSGIIFSSPSLASDGTVYFGSHDRNFYAVTPDGNLKWKFPTGGPIDASPTVGADGAVYFTSTDGNLYALAPTGAERWHVRTGGYTASTAALDEAGNLYLCAGKNHVMVSAAGKIYYNHPGELPMDSSPAVTAGRESIYSIPWLSICGFPRDNPWPPDWTYQMDSTLSSSLTVSRDGVIYATSGSCLYALKSPHAAPPVDSVWPVWRGNLQQTGRAAK